MKPRPWLSKLWWRLARRKRDAELRAEIEFHLDEDVEEGRTSGLTEEDARRAARRGLGNRALVEEDTRAAWGWIWIERLGQDLQYAARIIRRRPGFSAAAILTLMLGIGGNTAVFSLVDALLIRHLPVDRPEGLVSLVEGGSDPESFRDAFTLATHDTLQRGSTTMSGVIASALVSGRPAEIDENGEKPRVFLQLVSDNYFDVLGVGAARGRVLHAPAPGSPGEPIAVISDDYWRRHYGANPSALGARFRSRNREFTVAGIAPPGFRGTEIDAPVDIWVSIEQVVPLDSPDRRRGRWMRVMGRLQPGITAAAAAAESSALLGRPVTFQPGAVGYSALRRRLSQPLLLVALVVALVLLIACANLANLMLASTVARAREIAVRTAIGASRSRILRQLLTESLVLSAIGGVLAIGVAFVISAALLSYLPSDQAIALPNLRFAPNARVLGFAALLSCVTCLLFGVVPALRATGSSQSLDLKMGAGGGQRTRSWMSRGLLVGQVVMCTMLVTVASVFLRSLENLRGQDSGYLERHLLIADVEPPRQYPEDQRDRLIEDLRARAAAMPGVDIAAFSHLGQLSGGALEYRIGFPGRSMTENEATVIEQRISPGFLTAMGTTLIAGRDVAPSDNAAAAAVALVNESFVRRFLPGTPALGARFSQEGGSRAGELLTVIGVVKDSKWVNLRDDSPAMYYRPYQQQAGSPVVRLAIRTSGDPAAVAQALPLAAQAVDRRMVLTNVMPFRDVVNRTLVVERLIAEVSAAFGALALVIASVGLYGVLAYSVLRRRREIGVRIAVGADPRAVAWMFLRESLTLLAVGIAIGLPAAVVVTQLVSSFLFGLTPQDPASIGAALAVMTGATVAAAYLPARRAAGIDPILALREE